MEYIYKSDLENGKYRNPILFADYSDPDVIRVDDTFYMTASSFNYIPGLPILTSKDLVNWKLVNYAIESIDYEKYDVPQHAKGVWAPAIRYHEGCFYIFYGMPDEGIFMVKTENPLGKWDTPVCVLEGKGLIDPCPFWDEDGKAYVIHGYAKSRIGFKSFLGIFEMNWEATVATTEDHILFDGLKTQHTIEGPKVYKRDGFYYILAPAGGVKTGWQTALRSKNIYGPYEEKIVLEQKDTIVNGPHQGGLVDTVDGEEWFLHFQDRGLYGRIVHLQPVTWVDGWPAMGTNIENGCGEPVLEWKKPNVHASEDICYLEASDEFDDASLNLMWQWMGNPKESFYDLGKRQSYLRLNACNPSKKTIPLLWECSNVLTQKLIAPEFEAECCLDASSLKDGEMAGFIFMGGEYAFMAVRKGPEEIEMLYGTSEENDGMKLENIKVLAKTSDVSDIKFSVTMNEKIEIHMYYQIGQDAKHEIEEAKSFVPSDHTWVGAKLGLFAVTDDIEGEHGYAEFDYIRVKPLTEN